MMRQKRRKRSFSPGAQDRDSVSNHDDLQLLRKDMKTRKDMYDAQLKIQVERLNIEQKRDQRSSFYQKSNQEIEGRLDL